MHAHGFDPLWLTIIGLAMVVAMICCWIVARAEALAEECPAREMPELHPDDDARDEFAWSRPRPGELGPAPLTNPGPGKRARPWEA